MITLLLDFLFPRRSVTGREGEWLTPDECRMLACDPLVVEKAELSRRGIINLDSLVAAVSFKHPLARKAIHTLKYGKVRGISSALGLMLAEAALRIDADDGIILCPVPLHWRRRFARGFNQAELLAMIVEAENGWACRSLIRRTRFTGSQVGRGKAERLRALDGAFMAHGPVPVHVIVVDDVCTTGTTLDQCAAALKRAGAMRVTGLVVAVD